MVGLRCMSITELAKKSNITVLSKLHRTTRTTQVIPVHDEKGREKGLGWKVSSTLN